MDDLEFETHEAACCKEMLAEARRARESERRLLDAARGLLTHLDDWLDDHSDAADEVKDAARAAIAASSEGHGQEMEAK